ncbi:MAG TPA: putative lipid II flippase FtsW [Gammaproteobacteria bacterium]|nr:putative lipid II flippase FtsW [Gammaproteobacteria bacterium]
MSQALPRVAPRRPSPVEGPFDLWLTVALVALVSLGLVMVASASISIASRSQAHELYYFWRQLAAFGLGGLLGYWVFRQPLERWQRLGVAGLLLGIAMLIAVLLPGVGHEVNGSMRWLNVGLFTVQASEPVKLAVIVYVAGYLVRHQAQVRRDFLGFAKPVLVMTVVAGLLLLEPDFGAAAVLFATTLGMLFMGGVPILRFLSWGMAALVMLASLAMLAPYRMQRLLTFRNPWADPYDTGFQLTQALIAFGRGEWFGVGLGNSVQKLFYLPEVHTDFIFAVVGEELGLIGTVSTVCLFVFFVWRILHVGGRAEQAGMRFGANLAYGIALLIGLEAFINIGVNMGILPTKGLTLPFISYGSNSTVMLCCAMGLVFRVAYETNPPPRRPLAKPAEAAPPPEAVHV